MGHHDEEVVGLESRYRSLRLSTMCEGLFLLEVNQNQSYKWESLFSQWPNKTGHTIRSHCWLEMEFVLM